VSTESRMRVAQLEAQRLQNSYAYAIDTRDWELFQTLFAVDVIADYPNQVYQGMEEWLASFIPMHDGYPWSRHEMTNHIVGQDDNGIWAVCYGFVEWTMVSAPGRINTSRVIYRDRLQEAGGRWIIRRRKLTGVSSQPGSPIPGGMTLPNTIQDFADNS